MFPSNFLITLQYLEDAFPRQKRGQSNQISCFSREFYQTMPNSVGWRAGAGGGDKTLDDCAFLSPSQFAALARCPQMEIGLGNHPLPIASIDLFSLGY